MLPVPTRAPPHRRPLGSLHGDPCLFPREDVGSPSMPGDRGQLERGRGWEVSSLLTCWELHGTKSQKTQHPANPRSVLNRTQGRRGSGDCRRERLTDSRELRSIFLKTRSPPLPSASSGNSDYFFDQSWGFWDIRAGSEAVRVDSVTGSLSPDLPRGTERGICRSPAPR